MKSHFKLMKYCLFVFITCALGHGAKEEQDDVNRLFEEIANDTQTPWTSARIHAPIR